MGGSSSYSRPVQDANWCVLLCFPMCFALIQLSAYAILCPDEKLKGELLDTANFVKKSQESFWGSIMGQAQKNVLYSRYITLQWCDIV